MVQERVTCIHARRGSQESLEEDNVYDMWASVQRLSVNGPQHLGVRVRCIGNRKDEFPRLRSRLAHNNCQPSRDWRYAGVIEIECRSRVPLVPLRGWPPLGVSELTDIRARTIY